MATRSDMTAAAHAGFSSRYGYAAFSCVELIFGTRLRAKVGSVPPVPDSSISWTGRGDLSQVWVLSSIDDGATWQRVYRSGDPIPMSDGTPNGQVPWPVGSVVTNRNVRVRLVYVNGGNGAIIDSLTVTAALESGDVITRTETLTSDPSLLDGRLVSVGRQAGGLRALGEVYLRLNGARAGAVRNVAPAWHDADGVPQDLHVSHGDVEWRFGGKPAAGKPANESQADNPARYGKAAMSWELLMRPERNSGYVGGWSTVAANGKERGGLLLFLEAAGDDATLRVQVFENFGYEQNFAIAQTGLATAVGAVKMNRWWHVCLTYDGFSLKLFLNLQLVAYRAVRSRYQRATEIRQVGDKERRIYVPIGIVIPTDGRFTLGRHPVASASTNATSFQGLLSECRIYAGHALTAGAICKRGRRRVTNAVEIADMVANEGLRALYPLNETSGTVAHDISGHGLDLQLTQEGSGGVLQGGWDAAGRTYWFGFPTGYVDQDVAEYSPGREGTPLHLDVPGDVLNLSNAPHTVEFPLAAPYNGSTFAGLGDVGTIDVIQEPADLVPTGARLSLPALKPQFVALALRADYLDRPCRIWQVLFDPNGVLVQNPVLAFEGQMDTMNIAVQDDVAAIEMTAESHLRRWSQPGTQRWNDQAHRAEYPDDFGLAFLAAMVDSTEWWPARTRDENSDPEGSTTT
jgi:hypothetical protein